MQYKYWCVYEFLFSLLVVPETANRSPFVEIFKQKQIKNAETKDEVNIETGELTCELNTYRELSS